MTLISKSLNIFLYVTQLVKANLIEIKPWDESIDRSVLVELYNQKTQYLTPKLGLKINEEMLNFKLGKVDLRQAFLRFENWQGEIIAFAGIVKSNKFKDSWEVEYGFFPKYLKSELPGKIILATLDLGRKLKIPTLIFKISGSLSAPFDEKLKTLGFKPFQINYKMILDDFNIFKIPEVPKGVIIQKQKKIHDYRSFSNVLNQAFQNSFKFKTKTEEEYEEIYESLRKLYDLDHCLAYEDNKLVGTCNIFINPKQKYIGILGDLATLPSHQNRRIGNALFGFGVDLLRKKGCTEINLTVEAENEKALNLYKRYGFYTLEELTEKVYQII